MKRLVTLRDDSSSRRGLQHLRVGESSLTSVVGSSIVEAMEAKQMGALGEGATAAAELIVAEGGSIATLRGVILLPKQ